MRKHGNIELALLAALRKAQIQATDAAVVALAKQYARTLDAPMALMDVGGGPAADMAMAGVLAQVGAAFRLTLVELGLTPKARASIVKDKPAAPAGRSPLDELRARRANRTA